MTLSKDQKYSILFIGNSYTFYNDMPTELFAAIASAAGYQVEVTAITCGGYTLKQHADPENACGAKVEAALTGEHKYDFVVLQEQSVLPASENVGAFYGAVRNLAVRVRKAGAQPVLYATWGRKTGEVVLEKNRWTNTSMTWKVAAAYNAIGEAMDIPVAFVGLAFYDVYTQGNIELYDSDMTHPSYAGSYLAAMTLFSKIFQTDPTAVNYDGKLSAKEAKTLRKAAQAAVFEAPEIPVSYKASSAHSSKRVL